VVRIEPRLSSPGWLKPVIFAAAVVVALILTALLQLATGHSPGATFSHMIQASVTQSGAITGTLASATPLVFTGLAASFAFRMRLFNIGGEGQLYVGAIAAAGVGLALGGSSGFIVVPVMVLAGALGGALWALVPGLLRAYAHTSEILTSLMLNYVAGLLAAYLILDSKSYWRDLSSYGQVYPTGKTLSGNASWPGLSLGPVVIPFGFLLGVVLAGAMIFAVQASRFGFAYRVTAHSTTTAHYAGMRTKKLLVTVMVISGAIAGLAGASQVGDFSHTLDPNGLQQSLYGYTGIVVAALAGFDPVGVIIAAVVLGGLGNAGFALQGPKFPNGLVGTMEGVILFCVLGSALFTRYSIRIGRRSAVAAHLSRAPENAEGSSDEESASAVDTARTT
jgi:ABC-type uncharacterized transport system permease subunit